MKMGFTSLRFLFVLLLVLTGLGLSGCATNEPDNMSARPWNSPRSWETGLPTGLLEDR